MLAWFTARLSFVHYPKISPYLCVSISVVLWLPTAPSLSPLPSSSLQDSNQDGEEAGEEEDDDDDDGGQQCWDATMRPAVHTPSSPSRLLPQPAGHSSSHHTHTYTHTLAQGNTHCIYQAPKVCHLCRLLEKREDLFFISARPPLVGR